MKLKRLFVIIVTFVVFSACEESSSFRKETVDRAIENGKIANEGFLRSLNFVKGWLTKTDSATGLIPTNLTKSSDVWEPHNSAADNYAFMVLTTFLLDKDLYNGKMRQMLKIRALETTDQKVGSSNLSGRARYIP